MSIHRHPFLPEKLAEHGQKQIHLISLKGTLLFPAGQSLLIEPGVEVEFQGRFGIAVSGSIRADGNQADSIVFTVRQQDKDLGWNG